MTDWPAPMPAGPISAQVRIPGSKSLTNRWLVLAALADGPSVIRHRLVARDTDLMLRAITALGCQAAETGEDLTITPGQISTGTTVDCGLAGTVMRFVPLIAGLGNTDVRFDGDPQARVRPMSRIIQALRDLGIEVDDDGRGTLPFTVHGAGAIAGGELQIDATESSQFVSALLLAGARFANGLDLMHTGSSLPSQPHIDMTIETLRKCGVNVSSHNNRWRVPESPIKAFAVTVEPDLSNAAPFLAAAAINGGSVSVPDWPSTTTQAGDAIREILIRLGAQIIQTESTVTCRGTGELTGLDVDLHDIGELTPTIAALCALAESPSQLRGIAHLRGHETDRLAALETELNALGGDVSQTEDGLIIRPRPLHGGLFHTYGDHRMAMAGALLGLTTPEIIVQNVETTAKTLPEFVPMWQQMINA